MAYKIYDISNQESFDLEIQNCKITGNNSQYELKDGKIYKYSIMNGIVNENSKKEVKQIDLTNYQVSLFNKVRCRDGNSNILDENDLDKLNDKKLAKIMQEVYSKKNFYQVAEAKVTDLTVQLKLLVKGDENCKNISIEFEKGPNIFQRLWSFFNSEDKVDEKPALAEISDVNNLSSSKKTSNSSKSNSVQSKNCLLNEIFDKYIPKGYEEDISRVAKEADVSEDFVKLLFLTEGDSKKEFKPVLKAYEDSVGVLTIGLGHTNSTGTFDVKLDTEISREEAFNILIADINKQKKALFEAIGKENYEKIKNNRETLAYALLDWSFNAGTKRLKESSNVKKNLEKSNYFGLATTSIFNEDDARRSFYRMAFAISYMDDNNRQRVMNEFLNRQMKTESRSYKEFILDKFPQGTEEGSLIRNVIKSCELDAK